MTQRQSLATMVSGPVKSHCIKLEVGQILNIDGFKNVYYYITQVGLLYWQGSNPTSDTIVISMHDSVQY